MKQPIINALAFSLLLILCINHCFAQKANPDSTVSSYVENYVVNYYNKSIGQQSRLYNGTEYMPYSPVIKNNPYFQDIADVRPGTVTFDGFTYNKVPMMYDLYKDILVVQLYNNFIKYILTSERVGSFDLDSHHFVYISADTATNAGSFISGYYEQLYNGKTETLARYIKSMQNQSSGNEIETYFTKVKTLYYIKKGSSYREVSSEGDILNVLNDHKKQLQQYIKTNNINFKKMPAQAIMSIAGYYDHLNN